MDIVCPLCYPLLFYLVFWGERMEMFLERDEICYKIMLLCFREREFFMAWYQKPFIHKKARMKRVQSFLRHRQAPGPMIDTYVSPTPKRHLRISAARLAVPWTIGGRMAVFG